MSEPHIETFKPAEPYEVWTLRGEDKTTYMGGATEVLAATNIAVGVAQTWRVSVAVFDPGGAIVSYIGRLEDVAQG